MRHVKRFPRKLVNIEIYPYSDYNFVFSGVLRSGFQHIGRKPKCLIGSVRAETMSYRAKEVHLWSNGENGEVLAFLQVLPSRSDRI